MKTLIIGLLLGLNITTALAGGSVRVYHDNGMEIPVDQGTGNNTYWRGFFGRGHRSVDEDIYTDITNYLTTDLDSVSLRRKVLNYNVEFCYSNCGGSTWNKLNSHRVSFSNEAEADRALSVFAALDAAGTSYEIIYESDDYDTTTSQILRYGGIPASDVRIAINGQMTDLDDYVEDYQLNSVASAANVLQSLQGESDAQLASAHIDQSGRSAEAGYQVSEGFNSSVSEAAAI